MSLQIDVLRALLRLAKNRTPATMAHLALRVAADVPSIERTVMALSRAQLVQRTPEGPRLSLAGLAVAVACSQRPRSANVVRTSMPKKNTRASAVRRRRAA